MAAATSPAPLARYEAVVYDLDGTLIDFEAMSTRALNHVVAPWGKEVDWSVKREIIGMKGEDWSRIIIERLGLEGKLAPADFVAGWERFLESVYPEMELTRGADALTAALAARGVPQAIATSSSATAVAKKRLPHGPLFGRMRHVVTGNEVSRGKPHPDIFSLAAERLGVEASRCVAFEDAPSGVAAAKAAGMFVVAVPSDPRLEHERFAGADLILDSLEAFDVDTFFGPLRSPAEGEVPA